MPSTPCPICKKLVADAQASPTWPFCCDRCKLIDLGRWLDGKYFPSPTRQAVDADEEQFD